MATISRLLRELEAASRRAAREAARQEKLALRELALQQKHEELVRAQMEVEKFEERISQLTTIHHEVGDSFDWGEIVNQPTPAYPVKNDKEERLAMQKLRMYRPKFFHRMCGKVEKIRSDLEQKVVHAKQMDEYNYQKSIECYELKFSQWSALHELALSINRGDTLAYQQAILEINPLNEIQEIGCEIHFAIPDSDTAVIYLTIDGEVVVPKQIKTLTARGKLSVKNMPRTRFCELYQDYVCGCALRIARELFSFLPLSRVAVHVQTDVLDQATGHMVQQTILSVCMPRAILSQINFKAADPSEAMSLFPHRMGFKKTKGFIGIKPLSEWEMRSF